jgi:hypothetical protein
VLDIESQMAHPGRAKPGVIGALVGDVESHPEVVEAYLRTWALMEIG